MFLFLLEQAYGILGIAVSSYNADGVCPNLLDAGDLEISSIVSTLLYVGLDTHCETHCFRQKESKNESSYVS